MSHQRTLSAQQLPRSGSSNSLNSNTSSAHDDEASDRSESLSSSQDLVNTPPADNRRTRALLAQFYGVGKAADPGKKQADEFNLNNGAFNAEKYVKKLVRDNTLNGLLKKDVDLANRTFV